MPMKLNIGLCRKVGEANYGSRGANVNIELEVENALVNDPAKLQEHIRKLFGVVRSSLAEELNGGSNGSHGKPAENRAIRNGNGHSVPSGPGGQRLASPAQIRAIIGLSKRFGINLSDMLEEKCRVQRPDDLTLRQASQIIDLLKQSETQYQQ